MIEGMTKGRSGLSVADGATLTVDVDTTISAAAATVLDDASVAAMLITLGAIGRIVAVQVLATGTTSGNFGAATNGCLMFKLGAGGGGGAMATAAVSGGGAGGGGAGALLVKLILAITPGAAFTCVVGASGAGGAAGANNGTAGTASTFTYNAVTYTSPGGLGGIGGTANAARINLLGGASTSAATNGNVNGSGACGQPGVTTLGTANCCSGTGGSSIFGGGGNALVTQSAGNGGRGFGSGGGGACLVNGGASVAGGDGTNGMILLIELS